MLFYHSTNFNYQQWQTTNKSSQTYINYNQTLNYVLVNKKKYIYQITKLNEIQMNNKINKIKLLGLLKLIINNFF